tara:strand:+ start:3133 stop:3342 length:210 start_codon:yes stop_codon:yes gene_type:complete
MANGILTNQLPSSTLGLKGQTPGLNPGADPESTLHYESSINNNPSIDIPASELDLNGVTPPKYSDNLPG